MLQDIPQKARLAIYPKLKFTLLDTAGDMSQTGHMNELLKSTSHFINGQENIANMF